MEIIFSCRPGFQLSANENELVMTAIARDRQNRAGTLTVRMKIRGVSAHNELWGNFAEQARPQDFQLEGTTLNIEQPRAVRTALTILKIHERTLNPGAGIRKVNGDLELIARRADNSYPYRLKIPPQLPPAGQILSVVLQISDGASDVEKTARPDRLYTIYARYTPQILATLKTSQNDDFVGSRTLYTQHPQSIFIASIFTTGGWGKYNYQGINNNDLQVDGRGIVYIPETTQPLVGAGKKITWNVRVNDSGEDSDYTSPVTLGVTLTYIDGLPPLTINVIAPPEPISSAPDARWNNPYIAVAGLSLRANGPGQGFPLPNDVTVAQLSVVDGRPPYQYIPFGEIVGLTLENNFVIMTAGHVIYNGGLQRAFMKVTVQDSNERLGVGNIRISPVGIDHIGKLLWGREPFTSFDGNDVENKIIIYEHVGTLGTTQKVIAVQNPHDEFDLRKDHGDLVSGPRREGKFVLHQVQIPGDIVPRGQTLSLIIRASDGADTAIKRARQDRLYTVKIKYVQKITAQLVIAGNGQTNGEINITGPAAASMFVASLSVTGGNENYVFTGIPHGGKTLRVDSSGVIYIPDNIAPLPDGLSITFAVELSDSGPQAQYTTNNTISLTVMYRAGARAAFKANNPTRLQYTGNSISDETFNRVFATGVLGSGGVGYCARI